MRVEPRGSWVAMVQTLWWEGASSRSLLMNGGEARRADELFTNRLGAAAALARRWLAAASISG